MLRSNSTSSFGSNHSDGGLRDDLSSSVRGITPAPLPPRVTCGSWCVSDAATGQVLLGQNETGICQIASITKALTCHLVLKASIREPELLQEPVLISAEAANIGGTTAELRAGEVYRVIDLLYGAMLPSGNDAAAALAEYVGGMFELPSATSIGSDGRSAFSSSGKRITDHPHSRFVAEMNREAQKMGLVCTRFGNPHGLSDTRQQSCAADVCRMVAVALRSHPLMGIISSAKSYSCAVQSVPDKLMRTGKWATLPNAQKRTYPCVATWNNTNLLLGSSVKATVDCLLPLPCEMPAPGANNAATASSTRPTAQGGLAGTGRTAVSSAGSVGTSSRGYGDSSTVSGESAATISGSSNSSSSSQSVMSRGAGAMPSASASSSSSSSSSTLLPPRPRHGPLSMEDCNEESATHHYYSSLSGGSGGSSGLSNTHRGGGAGGIQMQRHESFSGSAGFPASSSSSSSSSFHRSASFSNGGGPTFGTTAAEILASSSSSSSSSSFSSSSSSMMPSDHHHLHHGGGAGALLSAVPRRPGTAKGGGGGTNSPGSSSPQLTALKGSSPGNLSRPTSASSGGSGNKKKTTPTKKKGSKTGKARAESLDSNGAANGAAGAMTKKKKKKKAANASSSSSSPSSPGGRLSATAPYRSSPLRHSVSGPGGGSGIPRSGSSFALDDLPSIDDNDNDEDEEEDDDDDESEDDDGNEEEGDESSVGDRLRVQKTGGNASPLLKAAGRQGLSASAAASGTAPPSPSSTSSSAIIAVSAAAAYKYGGGSNGIAARASFSSSVAGGSFSPYAPQHQQHQQQLGLDLGGSGNNAKRELAPLGAATTSSSGAPAPALPLFTIVLKPHVLQREVVYTYQGIKTGITPVAGGCLCTLLTVTSLQHNSSLSVLLPSSSSSGGSGSDGAVVAGTNNAQLQKRLQGMIRTHLGFHDEANASGGGAAGTAKPGSSSSSAASSAVTVSTATHRSLLITVLGSDCKTTRFTDTQAVASYALRVLHRNDLLARAAKLHAAVAATNFEAIDKAPALPASSSSYYGSAAARAAVGAGGSSFSYAAAGGIAGSKSASTGSSGGTSSSSSGWARY